jgi:hypothetical protein
MGDTSPHSRNLRAVPPAILPLPCPERQTFPVALAMPTLPSILSTDLVQALGVGLLLAARCHRSPTPAPPPLLCLHNPSMFRKGRLHFGPFSHMRIEARRSTLSSRLKVCMLIHFQSNPFFFLCVINLRAAGKMGFENMLCIPSRRRPSLFTVPCHHNCSRSIPPTNALSCLTLSPQAHHPFNTHFFSLLTISLSSLLSNPQFRPGEGSLHTCALCMIGRSSHSTLTVRGGKPAQTVESSPGVFYTHFS